MVRARSPAPATACARRVAPFYDTDTCADGKFISVGVIEPQFYARLLDLTGAGDPDVARQWDRGRWPELERKFAALFATRTRDAWCALLEGSDVCVAPVLGMGEAPRHPHNVARYSFVDIDGVTQPAPRFSRTGAAIGGPPPAPGRHGAAILADWGWHADAIAALRRDKLI